MKGRTIHAAAHNAHVAEAMSKASSTESGGTPPYATAQYGAVQVFVSAT
ncbi:hypothetical protein [Luteimonas panaciterrae]|nr:hypothetical protein [Luteimonas panaciterrae]